jgi:hypothetical protein
MDNTTPIKIDMLIEHHTYDDHDVEMAIRQALKKLGLTVLEIQTSA